MNRTRKHTHLEKENRRSRRRHSPAGRDPVTWERLFHRYRHRLAGVARRTLARYGARWAPDEVEEAVQEAWCRLVQHWGPRSLGLPRAGEGRTFTYLARTTRNVVVDWLRAASAKKRGGGWQRVGRGSAVLDRMLDAGDSPEEVLLGRELRGLFLARCRALLPRRERRDVRVLELAILDGWSSGEISRRIGGRLSPGAVASLVLRVRRRLDADGADGVERWSRRPARRRVR